MTISNDLVEARLRRLPATAVLTRADAGAISKLHAFAGAPAGRGIARRTYPVVSTAAAVLAMLLINVVVAYFAPAYGRALADSSLGPISSSVLSFVGLDDGDVTAVGESATSSGHTLRLVGGYADGLRTVLLIEVDGRGVSFDPKAMPQPGQYAPLMDSATVTDQFGHHYTLANGPQTGYVTTYRPLVWPASSVGARLTVHITSLTAAWAYPAGKEPSPITGSWTLHATLFSSPLYRVAVPPRMVSPEATYTFTKVEASRTTLVIRWTVSGPAVDAFNKTWQPGSPQQSPEYTRLARAYFHPQLFDVAGNPMSVGSTGYQFDNGKPAIGEMTMFVPGPGRYRLQLGDELEQPSEQVWITFP